MEENRNAHRIFIVKPEERIQLGKPKRRWEENLKTGFEAVMWEGVDWIYLAHEDKWRTVVYAVMNFAVP